jgi:polar amino acid transport system substrate-binding protein
MFARRHGPASEPQGWHAGRPWAVGIGLAALMALALSACGGGGNTSTAQGTQPANASATSTVNCSSVDVSSLHLVTHNELSIASDTTYAPAEYVDKDNPTLFDGYDMDLAREFARRLCLGPHIVTATFSNIIDNLAGPALGQQQWDFSISSFTINSSRLQKVDMIPYFVAGESTLVAKGNPSGIHSVTDMCGKTVSAQNGTVELFELQDANGTGTGQNDGGVTQPPVCKSNPVKILSYDSEEDVIAQVISGRAVAAYQDQPVTDYYISLHPNALDPGYITTGSSGTEGIVMRKDNPGLETAIKTALNNMVSDGTYQRIMKAWGQTKLACLPNCPPAS